MYKQIWKPGIENYRDTRGKQRDEKRSEGVKNWSTAGVNEVSGWNLRKRHEGIERKTRD